MILDKYSDGDLTARLLLTLSQYYGYDWANKHIFTAHVYPTIIEWFQKTVSDNVMITMTTLVGK